MPISFACPCGKSFRVAETLAGKRTKCPACAAPLTVPVPEPEPVEPELVEEEPAFEVVDEPDTAKPRAAALVRRPGGQLQSEEQPPPSTLARPWKPVAVRPADEPTQVKTRKPRRESVDSSESNGSVGVGLLMMVGAVVWFVVGYQAGRIFFYPPIMFVLGFVSLVRGMTNR